MAPSSSSGSSRESRADLEKVKSEARYAQYTRVDRQARHQSSSSTSHVPRDRFAQEGNLGQNGSTRSREHRSDYHGRGRDYDRTRVHDHPRSPRRRSADRPARSRSPYRHNHRSRRISRSRSRSRSRSPWRPSKDSERTSTISTDHGPRRLQVDADGKSQYKSEHTESAHSTTESSRLSRPDNRDKSVTTNARTHQEQGAAASKPSERHIQEMRTGQDASAQLDKVPVGSAASQSGMTHVSSPNHYSQPLTKHQPNSSSQQLPSQQPAVSRLAKRKRIAEVMAEANAKQKRLTSPIPNSPGHVSSAVSSGHPSPQPSADSPSVAVFPSDALPQMQAQANTEHSRDQADSQLLQEQLPLTIAQRQALNEQLDFTLEKDENANEPVEANETSAADYDPNKDLNEDRPNHMPVITQTKADDDEEAVMSTMAKTAPVVQKPKVLDMFADEDDEDDDMFAPLGTLKTTKAEPSNVSAAGLQHDYDDEQAYLKIVQREVLDGRYSVQTSLGKGMYASVVLADDMHNNLKVAIKIARNNDTMFKAAQHEVKFLNLLQDRGAGNVPIIQLLHTFVHKRHYCLVFECLESDLRELLKKHGRNTGLDISAVKTYARQMFQGLHHLEKAEIIHADLKPDNILVQRGNQVIKICDLGTAFFASDAEPTDVLVSRFYRAPEIMVGMLYGHPVDMWAIGCTLFELYTGRILFNGSDNNNMLRQIQECRGKVPTRMIKKSVIPTGHFGPDNSFIGTETSSLGKTVPKPIYFQQPVAGKDLKSRLAVGVPARSGDAKRDVDSRKLHDDFVDLLDQCLKVDPDQRIRPSQALKHRFFHSASAVAPSKVSALPFTPASVLRRD